jgi:hypothetical protein
MKESSFRQRSYELCLGQCRITKARCTGIRYILSLGILLSLKAWSLNCNAEYMLHSVISIPV